MKFNDDEIDYLIHATDYETYAIIGTSNRNGLWILGRESKMSIHNYLNIIRVIHNLGYNKNKIQQNCQKKFNDLYRNI